MCIKRSVGSVLPDQIPEAKQDLDIPQASDCIRKTLIFKDKALRGIYLCSLPYDEPRGQHKHLSDFFLDSWQSFGDAGIFDPTGGPR